MSARNPELILAGEWCQLAASLPILPEIPPIGDWIREQRVPIGNENTTYQGEFYDFDRFPVVARLVFSFMSDPKARELLMGKPTQTAVTTASAFVMAHQIAYAGGNIAYVMHDRESARGKAKDEIIKLLRAIPAVAASEDAAQHDSTMGTYRFASGNLNIGSAGSVNILAGIAFSTVFLDECELHPTLSGTTSINRARERLTGAVNGGKLIAFSKMEDEAVLVRDDRTRKWSIEPTEKTHLHAEYLSGNQLRYECRCPHCDAWHEPQVTQLMFHHCNTALPGMDAAYDFTRVKDETFWQCPTCSGRVHEGPEKEQWVKNGRWAPTPTAERAGKELYPSPMPGVWSARFGALTDLAFPDQLSFGQIALKFLKTQGDPVALRSFVNRIEGKPWKREISQDTTIESLRKLIPAPGSNTPPPWKIWDDQHNCSGEIPTLATYVKFVAVAFDTQRATVKYSTRAHLRDGSTLLLDYGEIPFTEDGGAIYNYLDATRFRTLDGHAKGIHVGFIDPGGHHFKDVMLITAGHGRLFACRGEGMADIRAINKGTVWQSNYKHTSGIIQYWSFDAPYWERKLYVDCIQKHDPLRVRWYAPALWMPSDVSDDFMLEHTRMHPVFRKGRELWERITPSAVIDYADTSKMHLIIWWLYTGRAITDSQNATQRSLSDARQAKPKPKPRARIA